MKETAPPSIARNDTQAIRALFDQYVIPTYGRFELAFTHGVGSYVWDVRGRRYLDFGGGIAVLALGHAHPEVTAALIEQSRKLVHVSNLYFHEPQGRLALGLAKRIGPGKCFFCNSGAEANEGLFKLARRFGHEEGRFEILTAENSFHGRTLAGIAATGQEKVRKGFEPVVPGFRHIPFNDLDAARKAISPSTAAILIEGIQGESGITAATPDYLLGLRRLCDEKNLLLLMDEVQCGHFRTGRFQSYQRILEGTEGGSAFLPDAVSMAKSLAGGFPMGAVWVGGERADLLGPGSHGSTFGGAPIACAVALRVLEIIERDSLERHARDLGEFMMAALDQIRLRHPGVVREVRGLGLMIGIELEPGAPGWKGNEKSPAAIMVDRLHEAGLLTVPAGTRVVRWLPPLNLRAAEAEEGLRIFEGAVKAAA